MLWCRVEPLRLKVLVWSNLNQHISREMQTERFGERWDLHGWSWDAQVLQHCDNLVLVSVHLYRLWGLGESSKVDRMEPVRHLSEHFRQHHQKHVPPKAHLRRSLITISSLLWRLGYDFSEHWKIWRGYQRRHRTWMGEPSSQHSILPQQ